MSAEVLFGIVNTGSLRFFWKCKKRKTNRNKKKKKENAFMYLPLLSLSFLGHKHASNLLIIMIVLSCKLTRLLARTAISKFAKYVTRSFSSVVFTFSFKIVATMFFGNCYVHITGFHVIYPTSSLTRYYRDIRTSLIKKKRYKNE